MNALLKKLNFKDQEAIYVVNAPASFQKTLDEMSEVTELRGDLTKAKDVAFALGFATKKSEVDQLADRIAKASSGDAVVWVAYPKGSSKKYACEFNRDNGWDRFGANGFEPVRQVAIDEDWSALRFRRVEHIKTMTRSFAMTEAGRKRTADASSKSAKVQRAR